MSFAEPRLLWLLAAAPVAAGIAAWLWRVRLAALAAWAARGLWSRLALGYAPRRVVVSVMLLALATAGVALALARPRWGETREQVERRGVDVVFVLDTSLSMAANDVRPSRLWVASALVRRLVDGLAGHRVALVQAEGDGVAMAPLTVDAGVVDLLLDSAAPASLPVPGTRLATSLDTAAKLFPQDNAKHRVIIVLSDGEDHGGGLEEVGRRLAEAGVVVHAIGIGSPAGSPIPLPGSPGAFKRDAEGEVVVTHLEEGALEGLARTTGGLYDRVESAGWDVAPLVARIESLESQRVSTDTIGTTEERFQWPLAAAVAAALGFLLTPALRPANGAAVRPGGRAR